MDGAGGDDGSRVLVFGGGPAGLTAAFLLSKSHTPCTVFEKDTAVGGLAKTVEHRGYLFDLGGHRFFTKAGAVEAIWDDVLPAGFNEVRRLSRIYYKGKLFDYPVKAGNALMGLGPIEGGRIAASYARCRLFPKSDLVSFEDWAVSAFGRRLYEIFFKTYTEKVWGMPCSLISADWAGQRIMGMSLTSALWDALVGHSEAKSLIRVFRYPTTGPGMMWNAMRERIIAGGGAVETGAELVALNVDGARVVSADIKTGSVARRVRGAHFISSVPLKELIGLIRPKPPAHVLECAGRLRFRSFIFVALAIDGKDVFPDNWIYVHSPDFRCGRLQNTKKWSPAMVPDPEKTLIGMEYFCAEGDGLWAASDDELIGLASDELCRLGFAKKEGIMWGRVVRVPDAYPVYTLDYKENLKPIRDYLGGIENLQCIGRGGQHRYNNMDHSMLTSIVAVENLAGASRDIWSVNADGDYHETKASS